jgi:hypothetical protein
MGLGWDRSRGRGSRLHRLPRGHDEDVFARDAAAGTGAGDGVEIDVVLFREATHRRGGATAAGAVGVIFGGGWRRHRR